MENSTKRKLSTINYGQDEQKASQFESFFKLWLTLERRNCLAREEFEAVDDATPAQTNLMELVASVEAKSLEDIAYKLALWRWDAPDLDDSSVGMSRCELVAYSAFRDLINMTGLESLMKPEDIESRFYRDQML
ncbi:MAG: hypothetical protein RIE56_04860 [Amphiplicatus sp.]